MKHFLSILFLVAVASAVFAESGTLFNRDGISLSYKCEQRGTYRRLTTPGNYETCKRYYFTVTLRNNSSKDVEFNGAVEASYFDVAAVDPNFESIIYLCDDNRTLAKGAVLTKHTEFILNTSYSSPGTPRWSVPRYKISSGSSSTAGSDIDGLLDRYESMIQKIKSGQSVDMTAFQDLNSKLVAESGIMRDTQMQRFIKISQSLQ
jgi:hypothetical protein